MLQQILRDLYVDPEILAELDEQQKQTLFCKMREEQVRRWKVWDSTENNKITNANGNNSNIKKKAVSFMKGQDGEPWVWVMGEHENDKSIEDILNEEAREKARKQAEKEAEELRKQVEVITLCEYIDLTPKIEDLQVSSGGKMMMNEMVEVNNDDLNEDIYCSVDVLREKIKPVKVCTYNQQKYNNVNVNCNNKFVNNVMDGRMDVLQEISLNTQQKVAQKVALWEKKLTEERTSEIFNKLQRKKQEAVKEAEEAEKKQEQLWIEQERKAKLAEQQIREIARKAREEHRLTSNIQLQTAPYTAAVTPGVPPGKQAVIDWYKSKEIPRKAGLLTPQIGIENFEVNFKDNLIEPWFHGLITRVEAEALLQNQAEGTFLVRLSERIWGYAISYKSKDKCKHYLVNNNYSFLGNNQMEHKSLGDLINHHRNFPLSGGEKLLLACPRNEASNKAIKELFIE